MKSKIISLISFLGTGFYLLGGFDKALECLIVVVILDYITGVISAWYNKKLDSKVGLKGIVKKLTYFFLVVLSVEIDKLLGQVGIIRNLVIYFFVANDGLSILENVGKMNIPIPKKLKEALIQLSDEKEDTKWLMKKI